MTKKDKNLPPLEISVEHAAAVLHYVTRRTFISDVVASMENMASTDLERAAVEAMRSQEMHIMEMLREYLTSDVDIETLPRVVDLMDRETVPEAAILSMIATGDIELTNLELWQAATRMRSTMDNINGKGHFL